MYAAIQYNSVATPEEAITDIVGVATGTITAVTGLSANVNQANSTVTTTVAGGWELYDDVSATQKILRAVVSDMPGRHKYVSIEKYSTNQVSIRIYKDWNNTSHTGTQWPRYVSGTTTQQDAACVLFHNNGKDSLTVLSSSSNHLAGQSVYNNIVNETGLNIISEHTRDSLWDTPENDIIPVMFNANAITGNAWAQDDYNWFIKPETIDGAGNRYDYSDSPTGRKTQCSAFVSSPVGRAHNPSFTPATMFNQSDYVYDKSSADGGTTHYVVIPFGGMNPQYSNYGGDISSKCGIYQSSVDGTSNAFTNDIVTIGAQDYRVWRTSTSSYKYFLVIEA